jgi:hypothetical protein
MIERSEEGALGVFPMKENKKGRKEGSSKNTKKEDDLPPPEKRLVSFRGVNVHTRDPKSWHYPLRTMSRKIVPPMMTPGAVWGRRAGSS